MYDVPGQTPVILVEKKNDCFNVSEQVCGSLIQYFTKILSYAPRINDDKEPSVG